MYTTTDKGITYLPVGTLCKVPYAWFKDNETTIVGYMSLNTFNKEKDQNKRLKLFKKYPSKDSDVVVTSYINLHNNSTDINYGYDYLDTVMNRYVPISKGHLIIKELLEE